MDVSRLLAVVNDIEGEYLGKLTPLLKEVIQHYTAARDIPTKDNTPAIQQALRSLDECLNESRFVQYTPSKLVVLEAIGGLQHVGPGLKEKLNTILAVAGQTTAGIVTGLTQLQANVDSFRKACSLTKTGLESLEVTPHAISAGEFEVGILIPEELVDQKLSALAKELEGWNKIVRGFQEVAGDSEREVTVAGLASGSYEVYLPLGIIAAGLLSRTIDKVLEWYLKILEIRKRRLELQELGAPVAEVDAIKTHERDLLEKEIRVLASEMVKEIHPKVDTHRKNELETHITVSIRQIARFVDKGGLVEVDSTPPKQPEEPPAAPEGENATKEATEEYERLSKEFKQLNSEFERVSQILDMGRSLQRLPAREEPILQLSDVDSGSERAESEKSTKKKG